MKLDVVDQVLERVESASAGTDLQKLLRDAFPSLHFTFCMDEDVQHVRPVREGRGTNLYLVRKGEHCLSLTQDLDGATGLVVAETDDD